MYDPRDATLSGLLAASALGVYLLVLSGATAALADAAAACGSWPLCGAAPPAEPSVLVALAHRAGVAAVAGLLAVTAVRAWRAGARPGVRAGLAAALALYPIQVAVGAVAALAGAPPWVAGAHLAVGLSIFGAVALALAWRLEAETAGQPEPLGGPAGSAVGGGHGDGGAPRAGAGFAATPGDDDPEASEGTADPASRRVGIAGTVRAYLSLTKPRLMWLLCLVAAAGMALAAGPALAPRTVVLTLGGGVLAIGASGTFNHVLERDVDRRMARTADRPLATDAVGVHNAVAFGLVLAAASVALFLQVNPLTAVLGAGAIVFYSVVYTLVLKPHTVQNTVIGGFAGALPALIGWAAVTGRVDGPALALAGVVFLWTPAHFYNLAMAHREDYARGGFPMLPVVRGPAVARKHVLWYLAATLVAAATLAWVSPLGPLYGAATVGLGAAFLWAVLRLHGERTRGAAMRAFHASNAFLGGVLVAVVVDAVLLA